MQHGNVNVNNTLLVSCEATPVTPPSQRHDNCDTNSYPRHTQVQTRSRRTGSTLGAAPTSSRIRSRRAVKSPSSAYSGVQGTSLNALYLQLLQFIWDLTCYVVNIKCGWSKQMGAGIAQSV